MPGKAERIEKAALKVAKAGFVESQETLEPVIGETLQEGMGQVGMMPRRIQVASLGVILREKDLMSDRQGWDGGVFDVAPKSGKHLRIEVLSFQVHQHT
jgi:hypothetical protein